MRLIGKLTPKLSLRGTISKTAEVVGSNIQPITIRKNGTYEASNGVDGFGPIYVNTPEPREEQEKTVDITENGTTEVLPDEGKVLSKVTVNVDVPASGGEDDFIGVKYSNFSGLYYNLPKTADARSLDKILGDPNVIDNFVKGAENGHVLSYMFANPSKNGNGGYFNQLVEVYLPSKAVAMVSTFDYCVNLTTIYGDLSNIATIGAAAFRCCLKLDVNDLLSRMPNLTQLGNTAFSDCTQITEIKFPPKITSIHSGAFIRCTNITDIYCPWAEGEVANAPWGATNATIHYNYVEGEETNAES